MDACEVSQLKSPALRGQKSWFFRLNISFLEKRLWRSSGEWWESRRREARSCGGDNSGRLEKGAAASFYSLRVK